LDETASNALNAVGTGFAAPLTRGNVIVDFTAMSLITKNSRIIIVSNQVVFLDFFGLLLPETLGQVRRSP